MNSKQDTATPNSNLKPEGNKETARLDTLGLLLLLMPLVGGLWMGYAVDFSSSDVNQKLWIGTVVFLVFSGILVGLDANRLLEGIEEKTRGPRGAETWAAGTMLVWPLFYPWWMFRRSRYGSHVKKYGWAALLLAIVFLVIASFPGKLRLLIQPAGLDDYNKGFQYQESGREDLAEQQYLLALQKTPELAEAHLNLGVIYLNRSWFDRAESSTKKAAEIFERTHKTWFLKSTWQQALSMAYNNLGIIEMNRGAQDNPKLNFSSAKDHWEKGMAFLRKALEIDTSNHQVQANIQRFQNIYNTQQPGGREADARQTTCKIEHWTWRNAEILQVLFVEGVVSPVTVSTVYIQAFDANNNFIGTGTGSVQPGGSFSAMVSKTNPTGEVNIKYTCQ